MIGVYKRLSIADGDLTEKNKDKSNSIENQGKLINNYLSVYDEFKGIPVVEYIDDGYTGTNFNRPAFQRMIEAVKSGIIDTVIVKDLSRFGRDYIEVGRYVEEMFPLLDVRFIAINNAYDSKTSEVGEIGINMAVSNLVNTFYSRDLGKKLSSANRIKWAKGIPTNGVAPYGYKIDPQNRKKYIIDKPAARVVKKIFELAIAGSTTTGIRDYLNDRKVPIPAAYNKINKVAGKDTHYLLTPHSLWDTSKIWAILRNYTYTGALVLGRRRVAASGSKKVVTVPKSEQYITENVNPPIVTHEEFIMAQDTLRTQKKSAPHEHTYALKKKIRCGYCRRLMSCKTQESEPVMYCQEGVRDSKHSLCSDEKYLRSDIETETLMRLKVLFSLLDEIKSEEEQEKLNRENADERLKALQADTDLKAGKLQEEKTELYEKYAVGDMTLKKYKAEKAKVDEQIESLKNSMAKAVERLETIREIPLEVQALINQMSGFRALQGLMQEVVKTYIESIYVYSKKRLDIYFRYQDKIAETAELFGISTNLFDAKIADESQGK